MAAKLIGTLLGQPIAAMGGPGAGLVSGVYRNSRDHVMCRDIVTLAGNLIGDQIQLGVFRSTAYFDMGNTLVWPGAFGAGAQLQVGDATHPAALGTVNIAAPGQKFLMTNWLPAWIGMRLWQRLGWASDPGGTIELLGTLAGINPASLPLAWQICGQRS